jgi:hypothetical protein
MDGLRHLVNYAQDAVEGLGDPAVRLVGLALVGFVFIWSGAVKLRKPWLTAMAMVDFGLIRQPRVGLATVAAAGELALGLALMASSWAPFPAVVVMAALASAVLWAFAAMILIALHSGRSFACFCFGDPDDHLSRGTLYRTAGLAIVASLVTTTAAVGPSTPGLEEWVLALISAAAVLGTLVLAENSRRVWRLPSPWSSGAAANLGRGQ